MNLLMIFEKECYYFIDYVPIIFWTYPSCHSFAYTFRKAISFEFCHRGWCLQLR